jgi:D-alanyl-D-alanine carboxypeptidase
VAPTPSIAAAPAEPLLEVAPTIPERAYAAIVVDAATGRILHEEASTSLRHPASLTKMMTLYLLFEQFETGRLSPSSPLPVSEYAASRPPTKIGVKAGEPVTADTVARALAVHSANDAAVVVAEAIAGSEEAFAVMMTAKARELGMARTRFANASGLPVGNQYTTARDMALLGRALHDRFPRWYGYFGTREMSYGRRKWKNTNRLLETVEGMNGIKTGYIRASGYNLVASVDRGGKHIIAVVIGGRSAASRNAKMEELIETWLPEASGGGFFGGNIL